MDFSPTLGELEHAADIVYQHMSATPQIQWPLLSVRAGCDVWVKHENHTPIGAFKVRGGLVYLAHLKNDKPDIKGIISATRGNHGQSMAFAASRAGLSATIVVPKGNNPEKNAAMKALGAELIEYGSDFQEAYEQTAVFAAERNLHLIGPFEPHLIHGVATYSLEFLRSTKDLQTIYVPIGMGSGICGMIAARDALGLATKIVGVVADNAPAYALSFAKGDAISTNSANTLADGVACRTPNTTAVAIINKGADRIVSVSEDEITDAMRCYFTDTHNLAEGAGAVPLAALLQEKDKMAGTCVGLILSGGNVDRKLFSQVLK
jgi:threonine dehydratase